MMLSDAHQDNDMPVRPEVRKTTPLDPAEILKRLQELREAKLLTEEEYQARISGLKGDTHPADS
ncbi:MAG TPA: hypothetical protein PK530_14875 [Anaerolineales bacterium]|nr:hypothetical protein [Anaerolineales bacterium]